MFEPGRKYIFSRTRFFDDMHKVKIPRKSNKSLAEQLLWANFLDGHVFIGLGSSTQTIEKEGYKFKVLPEWCVDGESDFF
jgi:hypothetical protein